MSLIEDLRQTTPDLGGDPLFYDITDEEVKTYDAKNRDYAGGGEDPNGNFNRISAFLAMYPGLRLSDPRVVALTYMMKQLDQVFHSLSRGYEGAIEGLDARLGDVSVYAKIVRVLNRRRDEEKVLLPWRAAQSDKTACSGE